MKYSETVIWKVHLTGMDWIISKEEYKKIYHFFKTIGVSSWIPMKDILACLAIIHHGIDIWTRALKEKAFEDTHEGIKTSIYRICELRDTYPEHMQILKP